MNAGHTYHVVESRDGWVLVELGTDKPNTVLTEVEGVLIGTFGSYLDAVRIRDALREVRV